MPMMLCDDCLLAMNEFRKCATQYASLFDVIYTDEFIERLLTPSVNAPGFDPNQPPPGKMLAELTKKLLFPPDLPPEDPRAVKIPMADWLKAHLGDCEAFFRENVQLHCKKPGPRRPACTRRSGDPVQLRK